MLTLAWRSQTFPREVLPADGLASLAALNGLSTPSRRDVIVFETIGTRTGVVHTIGVLEERQKSVANQLTTHLPGLVLAETARQPLRIERAWQAWQSTSQRSLATDNPEAVARGLLAALSAVQRDELLVTQLILGPVLRPQAVGSRLPGSFTNTLDTITHAWRDGPPDLDAEARLVLRNKRALPAWRCVLRVGVRAIGVKRQRQLLAQIASTVRTLQAPGVEMGFDGVRPSSLVQLRRPWRWQLVLNLAELLGLVWPLGDTTFLPIAHVRSRTLPPTRRTPRSGIVLGTATGGSSEQPVAIKPEDSLKHVWLLGSTGSGKSTACLCAIVQAMSAGNAVLVCDPKGDLISEVLARVPDDRLDDVVVVDPSDAAPVGINPLHQPGVAPEVITDQLVAVFKGRFRDLGPRSEDMLTAGLLTLAEQPDTTLVALPLLFTDRAFRQRLVSRLSDPLALGPFHAWLENLTPAELASVTAPLMNKLRQFLLRPRLRRVIGQPQPRIVMADLYRRRRIVLFNLNRGILGPESAALLGSLAVSMWWQATLQRAAIAPNQRHTAMVVLDEFQDYLHLPQDFADVLTQARGLGAGLWLSHQHLGQLPAAVKSATLANARSRIIMNCSLDDAQLLVRGDSRLKPHDLTNLGSYEAYASLLVDNEPQPFVSIRTLPPPEPVREPEEVIARSRQHYGVPAEEIDRALNDLGSGTTSRSPRPSRSPATFGVKRLPALDDEREERP